MSSPLPRTKSRSWTTTTGRGQGGWPGHDNPKDKDKLVVSPSFWSMNHVFTKGEVLSHSVFFATDHPVLIHGVPQLASSLYFSAMPARASHGPPSFPACAATTHFWTSDSDIEQEDQ